MIMAYSDRNRKAKKMALFVALPVCIFTTLLFRCPANEVMTADMPGGITRYSNRSREISTPSEYVHEGPAFRELVLSYQPYDGILC
jgi:hypothetical protein